MPITKEQAETELRQRRAVEELARREKPDFGMIAVRREKLPGVFDNPNKQLDQLLGDGNLDDLLPLDVKYDIGRVVGMTEKPDETRTKMELSLLYKSIADIPTRVSYRFMDEFNRVAFAKPIDVKKAMSEYKDYYAGAKSYVGAIKHGFRRAGAMMTKQLAGGAKMVGELTLPTPKARAKKVIFPQVRDWGIEQSEKLIGWGNDMGNAVDEYYRENKAEAIQILSGIGYRATIKEYITKPTNLVQGIVESSPLILEGILGNVFGGTAAAITTMSVPITGGVYADARKEGTDVTPAFIQSILTGTGEAAIEQWTLSRKLGLMKNYKTMVADGLPKILWEGTKAFFRGTAEEGTQELNRNIWQWLFTDRSQQWMANVKESMAAGGPIELAMAGAFSAAGYAGAPVTVAEQLDRVDKIQDAVKAEPTLTKEHKTEILQELDKVKDDVKQDVYAPVEPEKPPEAAEKAPSKPVEPITKPEAVEELEGIKKANPELTRVAQKSKTVEEFINKMAKGKPETVSAEVLTKFYNRIKRLEAAKPEAVEVEEKQLTYQQMQQMSREELLETMESFRQKEPYELTLANYRDTFAKRFQPESSEYDRGYIKNRAQIDATHKKSVKQALKDGKDIPTEVLKNYPDLAQPPTEVKPEAVEVDGVRVKPIVLQKNQIVTDKYFDIIETKDVPPVKEGYIRLYRGQSEGRVEGGEFFTPFLNHAYSYAQDRAKIYGGQSEITYIDLPKDIANKYASTKINVEDLGMENIAREYKFPQLLQPPTEVKPVEAEGKVEKPAEKKAAPLPKFISVEKEIIPKQTKEKFTPPEVQKETKAEIPESDSETQNAVNLMEGYWRQYDERELEINVAATKNQEAIIKALGKKQYLPESDIETSKMSQAMMLYIDLKEHPSGHQFAEKLSKLQKEVYELSKNLPAQIRKIADSIIEQNRKAGALAVEKDVIANARENYIAHLWEKPTQQEALRARFRQTTARAKARTLEGGIMEGWAKGKKLRVDDVTLATQIAQSQINQAIVGREMLKLGKKWGLLSDKQAEDWVKVDHPGFTTWRHAGKVEVEPKGVIKAGMWVRPADRKNLGKVESVKGDRAMVHFKNTKTGLEETVEFPTDKLKAVRSYGKNFFITDEGNLMERVQIYAEPELGKKLNNVFSPSALYKVPGIETISRYNAQIKSTILFTSLYHHQAFMRSYAFGSRGLNPKEAYVKGREAIMNMTPEVRLLVRNGLTIGRIQDYDPRMIEGEQTIWGRALSHTKLTESARKKLVDLRKRQERFLFNKLGPALKIQAGILELKAELKRNQAELESGEITADEIAAAVANLMNNDFGGLHLGRMGRSQTAQHIFRLLALAPDWTESNIRSAVQAFSKGETGYLHRMFWGRIAIKGLGATILFNLLLSAFDDDDFAERYKKAWETGRLRWLDIDITPIHNALGGADDKRKYFSLLGHFRDPIKFVAHPFVSAKHKGSVVSRIMMDMMIGEDWAGRKFTTLGELTGITEDGKNSGRLVKYGRGGARPIEPSQIPSYVLYEVRSAMPIPIQNIVAFLGGEMDAFDAITKSAGLMTATTYPERRKGITINIK